MESVRTNPRAQWPLLESLHNSQLIVESKLRLPDAPKTKSQMTSKSGQVAIHLRAAFNDTSFHYFQFASPRHESLVELGAAHHPDSSVGKKIGGVNSHGHMDDVSSFSKSHGWFETPQVDDPEIISRSLKPD